jgi:hypothetical protein
MNLVSLPVPSQYDQLNRIWFLTALNKVVRDDENKSI